MNLSQKIRLKKNENNTTDRKDLRKSTYTAKAIHEIAPTLEVLAGRAWQRRLGNEKAHTSMLSEGGYQLFSLPGVSKTGTGHTYLPSESKITKRENLASRPHLGREGPHSCGRLHLKYQKFLIE